MGPAEVICSETNHPPPPTRAAAASPPAPTRNPRRPGNRAPADGWVASPLWVEGSSWPSGAACRSSPMGLLLQTPRRSDARCSRLRAGWIGQNRRVGGQAGSQRTTPGVVTAAGPTRAASAVWELSRGLEPPPCCLQDRSGSSTACWRVLSLQLTSERSSSQCVPDGLSNAWWNDHENDRRARTERAPTLRFL